LRWKYLRYISQKYYFCRYMMLMLYDYIKTFLSFD